MTFANLYSDGLSILATHRLVKLLDGDADAALAILRERLEPAGDDDWELGIETRSGRERFRFGNTLRQGRSPRDRTSYALLHDIVLGRWLAERLDGDSAVSYWKDGTGEERALRSGQGDLLIRLRPVGREEFQQVVESGDVFPHKTTYFYPKLWSGLVFWEIEDPRAARR